jgi:hypothetical protein
MSCRHDNIAFKNQKEVGAYIKFVSITPIWDLVSSFLG